MSDSYQINGVTITPRPGGYYDLTHPSLAEPERVRGKEVADARAAAMVFGSAREDEQPLNQSADLTQAAQARPILDTPPEPADPRDAAIAALTKRLDDFEKAGVRTVATAGDPPEGQIPPSIPREYSGQMDSKTKAALGKLGITVSTIVLEESESIPPTGLFIGHNGRSYMILPGEEVDVPDFLLGVLDDAVMSAPQVDAKTQKVLGYRNRSKYPYRKV